MPGTHRNTLPSLGLHFSLERNGLKPLNFFLHFFVSCVYTHPCMLTMSHVESKDKLQESVISIQYVSSGDHTQVVGIDGKCPYPQSSFMGPLF